MNDQTVVRTTPVISSGKQPVEQPKTKAARDVHIIQAPSPRSTVQAPRAHTSTVPYRDNPAKPEGS